MTVCSIFGNSMFFMNNFWLYFDLGCWTLRRRIKCCTSADQPDTNMEEGIRKPEQPIFWDLKVSERAKWYILPQWFSYSLNRMCRDEAKYGEFRISIFFLRPPTLEWVSFAEKKFLFEKKICTAGPNLSLFWVIVNRTAWNHFRHSLKMSSWCESRALLQSPTFQD